MKNTPPTAPVASRGAASTTNAKYQHTALAVLYAVLTALAIWVVHDFIPAVLWAGVFAIALWPLLGRLERWPAAQRRPRLVAAGLVVLVAVIFVLPLVLGVTQFAGDAHNLFGQVQQLRQNGAPPPEWLGRLPFFSAQASKWWQDNLAQPGGTSSLLSHVSHDSLMTFGGAFGKRLVHALVTFAFMLMVLFFVFAQGTQFSRQLVTAMERGFGPKGATLATRMGVSVRGTVSGLVLVGLGEGALLGVAYFFTGVPHAILLAAVSAVAAMLPFCAPVIFCAAALFLLVQGATVPAAILVVVGVVVVFSAEHFVRPALIGGAARLPFLLVLFGILGGAETLGLLGLFVGPALMTILMVLWKEFAQGDRAN